MSSINSDNSCSNRTISQVMVNFFDTMKSGFKTSFGSPGRGNHKDVTQTVEPESPPRFQSFVPASQNLRILQAQKKIKRKYSFQGFEGRTLLQEDDYSISAHSSGCSLMTYDDMAKQRIGVSGPIEDPYSFARNLPKKSPSFTVSQYPASKTQYPASITQYPASIPSVCGRSMLTLDTQDLSLCDEQNSKFGSGVLAHDDLPMLIDAASCVCIPPSWPGKSIGFRAFTADRFRYSFKKLESEVQTFESAAREIHEALVPNCIEISQKQDRTRDFLQYTHIHLHMIEPIEASIDKIENYIDCAHGTLSHKQIEDLKEELFDLKETYRNLPEFYTSMWRKREVSEYCLYELNQFCVSVSNQKRHDQKIICQFRKLELKYHSYTYLMREYICQLWHHYELLRWGIKDAAWLKLFHKFESALLLSIKENDEAHDMLNQIEIRKRNIKTNMIHVLEALDKLSQKSYAKKGDIKC